MQSAYSLPLTAGQATPNTIPPDDAALARAVAGPESAERVVAFSALYQRYVDHIYAYLQAHTSNREDTSDNALLAEEDRTSLRSLLEPLSMETREIPALRFAAGLINAEIAAVLGKREGAVKKRLTRAMTTLKERSHIILPT